METKAKRVGKGVFMRVDESVWFLIKTSCAAKNITMQKWILRAIMKQIEKEKTFE